MAGEVPEKCAQTTPVTKACTVGKVMDGSSGLKLGKGEKTSDLVTAEGASV